jgi:ubiquinone/menaquinone biosynthesis C-methylase UbiE
MGRFWDERAKENALYFVDSRLDYNATDAERFWADGLETLDKVLELGGASIQQGDTVVDIGCGVGRLTRAAAQRGAGRVLGVDVSAEMLKQARELNAHLENVEFHHGDGQHLTGVPDDIADAIVSHVVFQHIPDPKITLGYVTEMGRVLKPGGWAVFQISNDPSIHRAKKTGLAGVVRRALGREPKGQANAAWLGSAVDLDELRVTAEAAGMDVEDVEGAGTQFCFVRLRRR